MKDSLTNHVFFSTHFTQPDYHCVTAIKKALKNNGIKYSDIKRTKDIWARDYMPIQIAPKTFVCYKYRPDYLLNPSENEKYITTKFYDKKSILATPEREQCPLLHGKGIDLRNCDLVLDGGNIVLCGNKIILTDKVLRENESKTKEQIKAELKEAFRVEHVILIPSDPYEIDECSKYNELPLCHADGILAPIDDNRILISDYSNDEKGYVNELKTILSKYFEQENIQQFKFGDKRTDNSWIYINFLRVGNVVLMPTVGNEENPNDADSICDRLALKQLQDILGVEKVIPINTRYLTLENPENNGGSLHCVSWNVYTDDTDN